jgi:hypothetical protein
MAGEPPFGIKQGHPTNLVRLIGQPENFRPSERLSHRPDSWPLGRALSLVDYGADAVFWNHLSASEDSNCKKMESAIQDGTVSILPY